MAVLQPLQCSSIPSQTPTNKNKTHHHRHRTQLTTDQPLDQIPPTDSFAWNTLLRSHLTDHNPFQTLLSYRSMLLAGARPDRHTLPLALTASRLSNLLSLSKQLHAQTLKLHLFNDSYILTSLMELYFHFHGAHSASTIFNHSTQKNLISWTLLSTLYLKESKPNSALQLFYQMLDSDVELDSVAFVTAAKACGELKSVHEGRKVLEIVKKKGFEHDVLVGNSLVKMYLECGRIDEARSVFEAMPLKDLVSWTTMINGYVQNGGFNEGLKLFREMCGEGVRPDLFSVSAVLPACARMAAYKNGRETHAHIIRHQLGMNTTVENALMDMYVKSGSIETASKIFGRMVSKDTISWTVMILGYSLHGQGEVGVELFKEMKEKGGVFPDKTTFAAALHACNTACLVEEGRNFFSLITRPEVEHYALMAGLLSHAGFFIEARAFIEEHRMARCSAVHRAVLDGCRIHRNVKLGKRIADQLVELEPLNAENYILLSNVYAANAKWEMVKELRETIRDMDLKPKRAYSWIEIRNKVHVFGTGDVSHPRSEGIYWELEKLMKRMREEEGYVAREDFSLHDVDEERECIPSGHSEMLAIGLGLISSRQGGGVLRVTKNLRVCRNCHDSAKLISRIAKHEIVLKDPNRFHHFKNGVCSCGDMW